MSRKNRIGDDPARDRRWLRAVRGGTITAKELARENNIDFATMTKALARAEAAEKEKRE